MSASRLYLVLRQISQMLYQLARDEWTDAREPGNLKPTSETCNEEEGHVVTVDQYVDAVRQALAADACEITQEALAGAVVTVGYRGNAKAATRMHTFTVVMACDKVDEASARGFTASVVDLAKQRKGTWRGVQSGVLALPVLVAADVDQSVIALMAKPFKLNMGGFAAIAHPVVVDVTQGAVHTFRGTRWWGYAYNGLIRTKLDLYLPDPGRVSVEGPL